MATPLIQPIRLSGGTIYTFTSAIRDLQKTFSDDDIRFRFSNYVLINLPDVKAPSSVQTDNSIVWENIIPGLITPTGSNNNSYFAESFQNYVLNQEECILEDDDFPLYDSSIRQTISERLFWKWLAKINAIKFSDGADISNVSGRIKEQIEEVDNEYSNVVKYIGDIDVMNNTERYSEVYINVPTSHGRTPDILFKTVSDANYSEETVWTPNTGNAEYIVGRTAGSSPYLLSTTAFYDDNINREYEAGATFGLTTNTGLTAGSKTSYPSNADGISIDFDINNYKRITDNSLTSFNQFNASDLATDFGFNIVLLYYSIKRGDEAEVKNLYGVLVLDDFKEETLSSYITRYEKVKPNSITKLNGNSYAFKFNIRFDSSVSNIGIEKLVNPESNIGMDLFLDASNRMKEAADTFIDIKLELISIRNRINNIENFFYSSDDLNELNQKINQLEEYILNNQIALQTAQSLEGLVKTNNDNLLSLAKGELSQNLSYNLDAIQAGVGIKLDKNVKNIIKIDNDSIGYNVSTNELSKLTMVPNDTILNNTIFLNRGFNYFKKTEVVDLQNDITIYIDTKYNNWAKGDSVKLVFNHLTTTGRIFIKTGDVVISQIRSVDLISQSPIIEIICLNNNLTFDTNILR